MVQVFSLFNKHQYLTALFLIFTFWLLLLFTSGSFTDGYHFFDDHEIAAINHDLTVNNLSLMDTIIHWVKNDNLLSRFRPFYYINRVIVTQVLGFNLVTWSLYIGLLSIITTFNLFVFGKLIQLNFIESILLSLLTVLGSQSEIWWQLGPAEAIGMVLLSIALIFLALSVIDDKNKLLWNILFCISLALMALSKESFILVIPSIAFIKVWLFRQRNNLSWYESLKKNLTFVIVLSLICALGLLFIKNFVGTDFGYAGVEGVNVPALSRTWNSFYQEGSGWLILVGICLLLVASRLITSQSYLSTIQGLSTGFIVFLLIVIPQVLLYSKSGLAAGRYLLPGVWGYALFTMSILTLIKENSKKVAAIFLFAIAVSLALKLYLAWNTATVFALEGKSTTAFLKAIEANTTRNEKFLIVANPQAHFEWTVSMKRYLSYVAGRNDLYLSTYGSQNADVYTDVFKETEAAWKFLDANQLKKVYNYQTLNKIKDKNEIDCIIVGAGLNDVFWQNSANLDLKNKFKQEVFYIVRSSRAYSKINTYFKRK